MNFERLRGTINRSWRDAQCTSKGVILRRWCFDKAAKSSCEGLQSYKVSAPYLTQLPSIAAAYKNMNNSHYTFKKAHTSNLNQKRDCSTLLLSYAAAVLNSVSYDSCSSDACCFHFVFVAWLLRRRTHQHSIRSSCCIVYHQPLSEVFYTYITMVSKVWITRGIHLGHARTRAVVLWMNYQLNFVQIKILRV